MLPDPIFPVLLLLSWAVPVLVVGYVVYLMRSMAADMRTIAVELRHLREELLKADVE